MRIPGTGLELGLRAYDDQSEYATVVGADGSRVSEGASGRDGTALWDLDHLAGGADTNPELMGRLKYDVYREMRLSDPAVRSLEWLFKMPVRAADWGVKANAHDPEKGGAELRADMVAAQFGLERHVGSGVLDQTWDEQNSQDLLYLSYGAQGAEMIWLPFDDLPVWRDDEGGEHTFRWLSRLAPRMAATVQDIEIDPIRGVITRLRQDVPGADWIPGDKLYWLVNEREGSNWYGQSLLRACYLAWRVKKALIIGGAIAFDRWQSGIPVVRHPPGKKDEAQKIGRGIRTHERAWVTLEGPPGEYGGDWDVDLLKGADSIADPVSFLRHLDAQIAMAGTQQFSSLGTTERGGRAVGEVLSDPYYQGVQAVADHLRLSRMRRVVRRLVDVNFGTAYPLPELTVQKIQSRNVAVIAQALADLTAAGFSFTDRDTQNDVRDILDFRHLPEPLAGTIDGLPDDVGIAAEGGSIIGAGQLSRAEFEERIQAERRTMVSMFGDAVAAGIDRAFARAARR